MLYKNFWHYLLRYGFGLIGEHWEPLTARERKTVAMLIAALGALVASVIVLSLHPLVAFLPIVVSFSIWVKWSTDKWPEVY